MTLIMTRQLFGELIAEAMAMFIIIAIGDANSCMYLLYDPSPYANNYWGVCLAWGLGVTIAIYVAGGVSGAHANPAVTLAFALYRGFPARKILPYWGAQIFGAFLGAAIVYLLFQPVIDHFNSTHRLTRAMGGAAGVFFTHPGPFITPLHGFGDEIIETAFLLLGIFAITEQCNAAAPGPRGSAVMIGLLVACIGASMGYLDAWALNPARDLGPRIFAYFAGWDRSAFPSPGNYWWVPIAGPLLGGLAGASAYQYLLRPFLPRDAGSALQLSPNVPKLTSRLPDRVTIKAHQPIVSLRG